MHLRTLPVPHLVLDTEFAAEQNAGDTATGRRRMRGTEIRKRRDTPGSLDRLLVTEASEGSGWAAALLLGVSFGEVDNGSAHMCSCDALDRSGRRVLHVAATRGDGDTASLLLRAHTGG